MTYPGIENDPAAEVNADRAAVEARRKERGEEYEKYVAACDIPWGSVNAYFEGEPVSTSTAERYGWLDLGYVRLADTTPADAAAVPPRDAATESAPVVTTVPTVTTAATILDKAKNKNGGNQ